MSEVRDSESLSPRRKLSREAKSRWDELEPEVQLQVAYSQQPAQPRNSVEATPENAAVIKEKVRIRVSTKISQSLDGVVDTGAVVSVIPKSLVEAWELKPSRRSSFQGFDGPPREYPCYWVELLIPDLSPRLLCLPASDRVDVLIGRDVLDNCRFTYDGAIKTYSLYELNFMGRLVSRILYWLHRTRDRLRGA